MLERKEAAWRLTISRIQPTARSHRWRLAPPSGEHRAPGTTISRRRVLTAGVGLGAALLWAGRSVGPSHSQQHGSPPAPPGGGNPARTLPEPGPLVEPEVRRSASGELRTTLRVRYAYQDIGDYRLHVRSYDG